MLSFSQTLSFKCWTTILGGKYNDRHVHRRERWSVKRLEHSVRSLSQPFNLYLSDSKCSTSQCPTMSISSFAFRKTSADILGYCQKFFFEVWIQSLTWCYLLSVKSQLSFYISLGGDSLCPDSPWRRQLRWRVYLPFPRLEYNEPEFWGGHWGLHWCQAT